MAKAPKPGPEYSREREWAVVLEQLRSDFHVFGEGLQSLNEKVDRIEVKVDRLETKVDRLEMRVTRLEIRVAGIESILPTLATKKDIERLEHRLVAIETSR